MGLFVLCLVLFGILQASGYSWHYGSKKHGSHEHWSSWESWPGSKKHDPWADPWRKSDPWDRKRDPWDRKHDPWDSKHDPWDRRHDPWDRKHDPWDKKGHGSWEKKHDPWDRKKHDPWDRKKRGSKRSKRKSLLKTGKAILSLLPKILDILKGKRRH